MKSKFVFRTALVSVIAALGLASLTTSAQAYPPGQNLTVTSTKVHVLLGSYVTLRVNKAKPNSIVKVKLGTTTVSANANGTGSASAMVMATATGKFTVTATNLSETATTTVWVPAFKTIAATSDKAANTGKPGSTLRVEVKAAKPASTVSVRIDGKTTTAKVGSNGVIKVAFKLPKRKGKFTVTTTIGTLARSLTVYSK